MFLFVSMTEVVILVLFALVLSSVLKESIRWLRDLRICKFACKPSSA